MALRELYNPESGRMRVAGFISGSGSNLVKIIEHEKKIESEERRSPYKVVLIFSENQESNAGKIGEKFEIPVIVKDISEFYNEKKRPREDLDVRREFDAETVNALEPYRIDAIAYAGYMSIATNPLIESFLGVNVHPADLSVMDRDKRKYTGAHAVRDAILAGETEIRATTHLIELEIDYGRIFMISKPVIVDPNLSPDENQSRLKEDGDWIIFPKTLEYLSDGKYSQDEYGNLYFDDKPIPFGLRLGS